MANMNEVTFELLEHLGVLRETKDGWTKEANVVSWNGGPPKLDIREWDPDHERMTRGITLWEVDAEKLLEILNKNLPSEEDFPKEAPAIDNPTEVTVQIVQHLGTLSEFTNREHPWAKECNIVSWNGGPPKVDIRDWDTETHERMSRGVTLTRNEALELSKIELKAPAFKVNPPVQPEDEEEDVVPKVIDTLIDRLLGTDGVEFERLSTGEIKVDSENGVDTIHLNWDEKPIEISVKEVK